MEPTDANIRLLDTTTDAHSSTYLNVSNIPRPTLMTVLSPHIPQLLVEARLWTTYSLVLAPACLVATIETACLPCTGMR